jgi:hypothetical protein
MSALKDIDTCECNKLIAKFMGIEITKRNGLDAVYPYNIKNGYLSPEYFKTSMYDNYHKDWSMLMPVLQKIFKTKIGQGEGNINNAYARTFGMINDETGNLMVSINGFQAFEAPTLLEAAYLAVNDFIKQL